jgi:hypothetical protein
MSLSIIETLLNRFFLLKNRKLNIFFRSNQKTLSIGDLSINSSDRLILNSPFTIFKIILTFGSVVKLTEMFLNKEIDFEGDILEFFRLKNYISFHLIK